MIARADGKEEIFGRRNRLKFPDDFPEHLYAQCPVMGLGSGGGPRDQAGAVAA